MTEREKETLKRKTVKSGMTVSEYARTLLVDSGDATIRVTDTKPLRTSRKRLRCSPESWKRTQRSAGKPTGTTSILKSRVPTTLKTGDQGKERVDGKVCPSTLNQVRSPFFAVASIPPSVNESA